MTPLLILQLIPRDQLMHRLQGVGLLSVNAADLCVTHSLVGWEVMSYCVIFKYIEE